ncbi:MAG TPA: glycoside hydrolase family 3 N-terminal domain-containing protein, partial [Nocardioides sp.]|nr:glycoside hydrolase family 3 N-terminal domain-containing protein [Nocardioides sp.]
MIESGSADHPASLALQVLLPGFTGTALPDDHRALLAQGLAGICYFGSNTADGPATTAALSAAIRRANPAAVIAVDEEGGDVSRLHTRTPSPVLGAAALGAVDDLALTEAVGGWIGAELAAVGISLDLAPVVDVNSDPDNPVIGTRSFGTDPELVAGHAAAWTRGLQSAGVAACAKHFPGHGDTATDSHLALPTIDVDASTLERRELVPFAAAVAAGTAAVMTSHIVVPALDPDRPATLSPVVLGLLRDRLGFDGVIVSDALDMAGASAGRGIPEAAVLALASGVDLLCLGSDLPAPSVREVQSAIVAAVGAGRLTRARLEDAVARIDALLDGLQSPSPYAADAGRLLDADRPATLSPVVLGLLRDRLGFDGVIVSDALDMAGASAGRG